MPSARRSPLPVVRRPGRGGREVLHRDLQELEDRGRSPATARPGRRSTARPPGSVMTVEFELDGQTFTALNGGPVFKFNEAISFQIDCETQEEVDHYWDKLAAGGDPSAQQCGWLKDKYGVSWQVVPTVLAEMLKRSGSRRRPQRVDGGDAADEEARHRRAEAGLRGLVTRTESGSRPTSGMNPSACRWTGSRACRSAISTSWFRPRARQRRG